MISINKQWLQQKIADMEAARDEIPFGLDEDENNTLAALRIALASLEAEPVAWRSLYYENHGLLTGSKNVLAPWQKQGWECEPLYTAPPAPVSVKIPPEKPHTDGPLADGWNACRAAMLQGAEPVTTAYKLPEGWVAVPVEPTLDMVKAGAKAAKEGWLIPGVYRAMLAAAPQQEV